MDGHQVDDNNVLRAFYRCTIDFTTSSNAASTEASDSANADVARSVDGTGFSEAAALSNAKATANRKYRDKITSWGRQNCGMDGHQVDDNNVLRAFYRCTIDFTTRQ
jgi:hypothetical protein